MAEKVKVNPRVDLSQEGQLYRGRDTRVEWICTLPREKEPRAAKVEGLVVVSTRGCGDNTHGETQSPPPVVVLRAAER